MKHPFSFVVALLIWAYAPSALAIASINVMADGSLGVAVSEIARNYSREHGVVVNTSFVSPGMQAAQIAEGGAADVLITPLSSWVEELQTQGLVDVYSRVIIAKNQLALVGPQHSPVTVRLDQGFPIVPIIQQLGDDPGFVVGNPEALAEGRYGKEALRNMDAANSLEPYTLYIRNIAEMVDMVANHHAYGVMYASTAAMDPAIKTLDIFPENTHQPIAYHAVVIAGENMDAARAFLAYLQSPEAARVFKNNGFLN